MNSGKVFVKYLNSFAHQPLTDIYQSLRKNLFPSYYNHPNLKIPSSATSKATLQFSQRSKVVHPQNWKQTFHNQLTLSSIGIGSYIGEPTQLDDLKLFNAVIESVMCGAINVIDTAINYRYMKSERVIGGALKYLIENNIKRQELFICSKGGYIPEDFDSQITIEKILSKIQFDKTQVINNSHCIDPLFLQNQLETSLSNLGLQTLDLYYLHNVAESQIHILPRPQFENRIAKAFEFLQSQVRQNKIKNYGLATWNCFRVPDNSPYHLQLQRIVQIAKQVAGQNNHFKFIQLPINLMMPEAIGHQWQTFTNQNNQKTKTNIFAISNRYKINVISSSSLMSGTLINIPLSKQQLKCTYNGAKHLQIIRSIPAPALVSTLIGNKTSRHVKTNLEVTLVPRLTKEQWINFMRPTINVQQPQT